VLCADIDAFDLEVACDDPVKLVDLLVALEPTFGGINLEDIKVGGNQQPHQL
jgi:malate dehydrogenase (oxaloacetate-decarboxylating)(NADP+)